MQIIFEIVFPIQSILYIYLYLHVYMITYAIDSKFYLYQFTYSMFSISNSSCNLVISILRWFWFNHFISICLQFDRFAQLFVFFTLQFYVFVSICRFSIFLSSRVIAANAEQPHFMMVYGVLRLFFSFTFTFTFTLSFVLLLDSFAASFCYRLLLVKCSFP